MAGKMIHMAVQASILTILLALHHLPTVISDETTPIPSDKSQINGWLKANIKSYGERKSGGSLDPALVTAEDGVKVIKVRKDGSGDFKTVTDAVKSIPSGNTKRTIVWIGGGEYHEKVTIERTKPFVTFYGSPNSVPKLIYAATALQYGTLNSATVAVESDYFTAVNIIFMNSAPKPDGSRQGAQASALRISGDKAAFYNCKFIGFQDTLCDDRGNHFFMNCYVEGTVDFIFGNGKSIYLNTEIHIVADKDLTMITAQARESNGDDSGYVFVHCTITGTGDAYLGRPWKDKSRVVYAYTNMGVLVNPLGWSDGFHGLHSDRDETVYFGEYRCMGPGAKTAGRVPYSKELSDAEAKTFLTLGFIHGAKWLLPAHSL